MGGGGGGFGNTGRSCGGHLGKSGCNAGQSSSPHAMCRCYASLADQQDRKPCRCLKAALQDDQVLFRVTAFEQCSHLPEIPTAVIDPPHLGVRWQQTSHRLEHIGPGARGLLGCDTRWRTSEVRPKPSLAHGD